MNKDRILKVIDAYISKAPNKNGIVTRLRNNYHRTYEFVMKQTSFLDKFNETRKVSFFERIYCLQNDLKDVPLCKNCHEKHVNNFNIQKNVYNKWCSPSCQASDKECLASSKKTRLEKYGDEKFNGTSKAKETRLAKYAGHYHPDDMTQKVKKTKLKRHGDENYVNVEKAKQTMQQKLEDNHDFWKDREKKTRQTHLSNGHPENWNNREKFKQTLSQFDDSKKTSIISKRKQTNIEKLGVESPLQNEDIKKKQAETNMKKYGVKCTFQTQQCRDKMAYARRSIAWKRITSDISNYIPMFAEDEFMSSYTSSRCWKWRCAKCGNVFESRYDDGHHAVCRSCYPIKTSNKSVQQEQICNIIKSSGIDALLNDRNVLKPAELDIYVPSKKLAIEYDGMYWHSDEFKDASYHVKKTNECEKAGIQLIHVFEYEWMHKQDIVKSRIKNLIGIYDKTVFARKCEVKEVSSAEAREFQERTHIQGAVNAKVNLGLYHQDKLIALMTFGRCRYDKKHEWELLRFCTELGHHVPGAAGKLLKHFEREHSPKSLVSYADRRWSRGKLYEALGFKLDHISKPNYWYYDAKNDALESRIKFQKHKLKILLESYDESKTEVENMKSNGYMRIFDCGNLVFVKEY